MDKDSEFNLLQIYINTDDNDIIDIINSILFNETIDNISLVKSLNTRYNEGNQDDNSDDEEFDYDKVMKNLKKKQKQKKLVNRSNQEKAILDSKIRQGEYFMEGEYTATMRTSNYLYLVELFNVDDLIEVQVLKKRKLK